MKNKMNKNTPKNGKQSLLNFLLNKKHKICLKSNNTDIENNETPNNRLKNIELSKNNIHPNFSTVTTRQISNPNFINRELLCITNLYNCEKSSIFYLFDDESYKYKPYLFFPSKNNNHIKIISLEKIKLITDNIIQNSSNTTLENDDCTIISIKNFFLSNRNYIFITGRKKQHLNNIHDIIKIYEIISLNNIRKVNEIIIKNFVTALLLIGELFFVAFFSKESKLSKEANNELYCYSMNHFDKIVKINMKNIQINKLLQLKQKYIILLTNNSIIIYDITILYKKSLQIKTDYNCINGSVIEGDEKSYLCIANKKAIIIYKLMDKNICFVIQNDFDYENRNFGAVISWGINYILFTNSSENKLKVFDLKNKNVISSYSILPKSSFYIVRNEEGIDWLLMFNSENSLFLWESMGNMECKLSK